MPAGGDLVKALNPLSFLELYKNGATMAKLVTGAALQFFTEGKAVSDLNGYYLLNETNLDDNQRAWYFSIWGFVMTMAGKISPYTTKWLGMRGFTTSQNIATALGHALTGVT